MDKKRIQRRQWKAAVSRHLGTLDRLVVEEDVDGVTDTLEKIRTTFQNFEDSHDVYHDEFEDEDDIDESEKYYNEVLKDYINGVKVAKAWLKVKVVSKSNPDNKDGDEADNRDGDEADNEDDDDDDDDQDEVDSAITRSELADLINMPKVELDKFDGNPLNYQTFITVFDEIVDKKKSDDKLKLARLLQYTTGIAKSAIRNCALISGDRDYQLARDILKNRFGSSHLISQKIISDLKSGNKVSKPHELQQLADELVTAVTTLKELKMLSEIDTQQSIIDILQRCPGYIRGRWRKLALETKCESDNYPSFTKFVEFMTLVSSEACDPVYGSDSMKGRGATKSADCNTVFNVSENSSQETIKKFPSHKNEQYSGKCVICNQKHRLFQCEDFKAMCPKSRLDVAVKHRLCYNCLLPGHITRYCRKNSVCSVNGCGKKHTKFIHMDNIDDSDVTKSTGTIPKDVVEIDSSFNSKTFNSSVYLPIVSVVADGSCQALALLDTGSTNTFVTERLATKLKLKGKSAHYKMNTVNHTTSARSRFVSLTLCDAEGSGTTELRNVIVVSHIPAKSPGEKIDLSRYPYLAGLPLAIADKSQADILIGMDNAHLLMPQELRCSPTNSKEPYAIRTVLGWTLNGPLSTHSCKEVSSHLVTLEEQVERLWEMERFDDEMPSVSREDLKVLDLWNSEIYMNKGHYVLPIPWRDETPNLPNNKTSAICRLKNLQKGLCKKGLTQTYRENLMKMIEKGYAEPVPESELNAKDCSIWYLPHHAVISAAKPGKVRIVFDCAAKYSGVSLNSQCLQGPDLNNKLLHVLLRFRQFKFAVMADVEAMYHQVKIPEKDRNALRFMWMEDNSLLQYRMTSHLFGGVWCASSSTFALRRTVEDFPTSELTRDTVMKCFYVDDMLKSVGHREEALKVISETREVLSKGGFNLTKFVANDPILLQYLDEDDRAKEVKDISSDMQSKALGIRWDVSNDEFYYVCKLTRPEDKITRRQILSALSSVYDPLGLIAPALLPGKLVFQETSRLKVSWDAELPETLSTRWSNWLITLQDVTEVKFQRCTIPPDFQESAMELHHFCDASERGYGACSFIRMINEKGRVHVALLTSKGRLAPIKKLTIPRLELSAALVAVKLDSVLRGELDLDLLDSFFWTDSQIVLAYIKSDSKRFKVFVSNRVSQIRRQSSPDQWHYISGKENPADCLSRGCYASEFPEMWFSGPSFLSHSKCDWPKAPEATDSLEGDVELKSSQLESTSCHNELVVKNPAHPIESLMTHYSSYYRLKKALCWIMRLKSLLTDGNVQKGVITASEMREAERLILEFVQHEAYKDELSALRKGKNLSKSSKIIKLDPILKDGYIVVGGRLRYATIPMESRHPILLPCDHKISRLIVQEFHDNAHTGTEWTLSNLRRKYWIIGARKIIKDVQRNCLKCKKLYGATLNQKMSDLPEERCTAGKPPFSYVGVDIFGPFYVKQGRSEVKRYGCVYTCFNTRAIHLEVLNDLGTDAFLNGFVRFSSRRGYPIKVWSDNGTNLVGAHSELRKCLQQLDRRKVIQAARRKEVEWVFNSPYASHHGGVWERMIRTVRKVMVNVLNVNITTDDVLHTTFCEIENIINSRPITKNSDDISDDLPLTPNHLLLQRGNFSFPWGATHETDRYRRKWLYAQFLTNQFWKRWIKEYLPQLQIRQKWHKERPNLKIGDLVLIKDENNPRGSWPLGLIIEVKIGRDGLVRSAKVKTKAGHYVRPITKLVSLESTVC